MRRDKYDQKNNLQPTDWSKWVQFFDDILLDDDDIDDIDLDSVHC